MLNRPSSWRLALSTTLVLASLGLWASTGSINPAGGVRQADGGSRIDPHGDADSDGVPDAIDNCLLTPNRNQRDTDGNGIGTACDPDLSNDGIVNEVDLHLLSLDLNRPGRHSDLNGDGVVDLTDRDILMSFFGGSPGPVLDTSRGPGRLFDLPARDVDCN
jgi:hypothetical protein